MRPDRIVVPSPPLDEHLGLVERRELLTCQQLVSELGVDLQALHAAVPCLMTWDDHEVENDYAAEWSEHMETTPEAFLRRTHMCAISRAATVATSRWTSHGSA
jgi:PhoD-like phosphatase